LVALLADMEREGRISANDMNAQWDDPYPDRLAALGRQSVFSYEPSPGDEGKLIIGPSPVRWIRLEWSRDRRLATRLSGQRSRHEQDRQARTIWVRATPPGDRSDLARAPRSWDTARRWVTDLIRRRTLCVADDHARRHAYASVAAPTDGDDGLAWSRAGWAHIKEDVHVVSGSQRPSRRSSATPG
jgi:hypothetical protein